MIAEILTPWIGTGSIIDPFRPLLADFIEGRFTDITAQPCESLVPSPNLLLVRVECPAEELAKVEADSRFQIIWSE